MARQPAPKSGITKVRFMMVEAEGTESDLSQIFSAIQSAVKPATTIIQQRLMPSNGPAVLIEEHATNGESLEDAAQVELEDHDALQPSAQPSKPSKPRKPIVPKVIAADLKTEPSLESYAAAHPVKTDLDRFLVIAAWFQEHRDEQSITANHIYTGYRGLSWPSGIDDFGSPLRKLKSMQLIEAKSRGSYSINHLGLARVEKLGKE